MNHIGRSAHKIDGVEHGDCLRAVRHGHGDFIAGADADGLQRTGTEVDLRHQRTVAGFRPINT